MDLAHSDSINECESRMGSRCLLRNMRDAKAKHPRFCRAFTLIELVIVLVILGVLAAIAIPKYVDLSSRALAASKKGMSGAVKSAFAIAIAENKENPTVVTLATYVLNASATPVAAGIQVNIDGTKYVVPTYTNSNCDEATDNTGDTVACVGDIS